MLGDCELGAFPPPPPPQCEIIRKHPIQSEIMRVIACSTPDPPPDLCPILPLLVGRGVPPRRLSPNGPRLCPPRTSRNPEYRPPRHDPATPPPRGDSSNPQSTIRNPQSSTSSRARSITEGETKTVQHPKSNHRRRKPLRQPGKPADISMVDYSICGPKTRSVTRNMIAGDFIRFLGINVKCRSKRSIDNHLSAAPNYFRVLWKKLNVKHKSVNSVENHMCCYRLAIRNLKPSARYSKLAERPELNRINRVIISYFLMRALPDRFRTQKSKIT